VFELLKQIFQSISDVQGLIAWGGTLLVCAIVFVETGLFFGFFLPGDSLLVSAGVFAATGHLRVWALLMLVSLCAVLGDQAGYWIGWNAGQALYRRPDSRFFKKRRLDRAHEFYEKHGVKAILLARFVPIIRTFCPPVAGAARMSYRRYLAFDILGGFFWVNSMVLLGYFLGRSIPNIQRRIHWVIAVVVFLSILPGILGVVRGWRKPRPKAATLPAIQPEQE
jgi:membrane-associated protein